MAPVRRATMVFRAALEPMLISAMMIVMEREKRMLLMGDGSSDYSDLFGVSKDKIIDHSHILPCGTTMRMAKLGLD